MPGTVLAALWEWRPLSAQALISLPKNAYDSATEASTTTDRFEQNDRLGGI